MIKGVGQTLGFALHYSTYLLSCPPWPAGPLGKTSFFWLDCLSHPGLPHVC